MILENDPNKCDECKLFSTCKRGQYGEGKCQLLLLYRYSEEITPLSKIWYARIIAHKGEE